MQPLNDDAGPTGTKEATPYAAPEPTHSLLNIGAILSVCAVVLAAVGSLLPFISLPGDVFQNGAPSSVLQFLSRALYSSFLNALPTVWLVIDLNVRRKMSVGRSGVEHSAQIFLT